jgi:lipopolysaccharide/colanic/teichoic acid biosynthesis glycosyltransferase
VNEQVPLSARQRGLALACKRTIDVLLSVVLLVALAPLLAVVAVAIRSETPGPVLFRQTRIGRGGRPFTMVKFRSMTIDADPDLHERFVTQLLRAPEVPVGHADGTDATGPVFKLTTDPRVTRTGAMLRRLSLDELPQLWNVIRGDMSLVGPRPDVPYAVAEYEDWAWRRFEVLPGLTGLWQVTGRGTLSPAEMLRLDVLYVDRWSLRLDLRLLLATIPTVLRRTGSA